MTEIKRKVIKSMTLREVSAVTVPAQTPALAALLKSAEHPAAVEITKYLSTDDGAKSFSDFLADREECERKWEIQEDYWPVLDALRNSVLSIVTDASLDAEARNARVGESVSQFLASIQSLSSDDTGEDIAKVFNQVKEHGNTMSEELTKALAQVAELTKALAAAEVLAKMSDADKKHMESMKDDKAKDEFAKMSAIDRTAAIAKAAQEDEVFKSVHGNQEIRKSDVGASMFMILKAQDDEIRKSREEVTKAKEATRAVELAKKADEAFKHLPGETVAKVGILKAMDAMSEADRGALDAILKAADAALAGAYVERGTSTGQVDVAKSAKVEELAKAHAEAHNVSMAQARVAVIAANPSLYE
jgi:hypothetical protein